ncbi:hypothetical protein JCM10908_004792 [Rhodotorula pacifica]|uniref:mismatch repair ATPase MSH6 n=1 Tax=Rhodotorula pacifica TaxID=1495444 RepID=UPI003176C98B
MSSQKPGGTQSTLLSFFGKQPTAASSSSPAQRNTPRAAPEPASSSSKPASKANGAGGKALTTSEADVLSLLSSDGPEVELEGASKTSTIPAKRPAKEAPVASSSKSKLSSEVNRNVKSESEGEEEDEESVARRKRPSLGRGVKGSRGRIIDSEDSEDEETSSPVQARKGTNGKASNGKGDKGKKPKKGKKKAGGDDDDFAASSSEDSDDYFDDGLDEALAELSDGSDAMSDATSSSSVGTKTKVKGKGKAKASLAAMTTKTPAARQSSLAGFAAGSSSAVGSRPMLKTASSGSGSIGNIKTAAEAAREKAKQDRQTNENVFSFLIDPKDADGIRPGEPGYDPRTLYIPKSAWATFTPFERQFWEIKQNHYDTVLFFQKGKFFELYEEDAAIGHRDFDLKLTDRVKMKMVGVPETSFDYWAAKFLAKGYKVGRVDQCETALGAEIRNKDDKKAGKGKGSAKQANGKEIVRRELKSVLTGGTIVDGSMLTDDMSNHCVAIKEDTPTPTSPPSFGVCVLDASTAEFSLSFFVDDASRTELETLIRQLKPKELIHQKGNLSVSTLRLLRNCVGIDCQWTALKEGKEFLRAEDARDEVVKLFKENKQGKEADEEEMAVDREEGEGGDDALLPDNIRVMLDKPVAMSALGGMVWYLRQLNLDSDLVTARNFNVYDPLSRGNGTLILDGQTLAHIEVLQNSQGGTEGTLLQLLGRCVTPFGKRLFKVWLCAPLRDVVAINDRLDAVDDLLANSNFAVAFDNMVKKLPDLERMLSRIHGKTIKKGDFCEVISSFERLMAGLKDLAELCEDFKSQGIPNLLKSIPDITDLLQEIQELYDSDELLPVDGKDEEYDRAKQVCDDAEEALEEALRDAKKQLKCPEIVFRDIGTKDIFQLEIPNRIKVPSSWTKMSGTQKLSRYYTPETTGMIADLKEARERKQMVVNDFQYKLYGEFDKHYSTWMAVIKGVAQLDCLLSLSKSSAALGEPCVRPEIVESETAFANFEELRHPCIFSASTDFIPNDVAIGGEAKNLTLLTGPNMAGKSTLLRMTCTAVIMAQLGCYVPAASARISPIDAIYSRMGANDFIFANASTFKVEMDDCNKILQKSTPRSLVILDELGRGTSTYDGMAIAYAVLHRLATHTGCIGFFATHFTSLTEDYAYHPEIRLASMQTSVNDETREVLFLYKLIDGSAPKSYGPHVASMAGLSEAIVERAIGISKQFEESSRARELTMRANETLPLTAQADAAFLLKLAKLKLAGGEYDGNKAQLLRTLQTMRAGFSKLREAPPRAVAAPA